MKIVLISLLIISIIKYAESLSKFIAQFFSPKDLKKPLTTFAISKGAYIKLFMSLTLPEPKLFQIKGTLTVSAPFILSDPITIDTFRERLLPIYVGLPCNDPSIDTEYKVKFELKPQDQADQVDIPELTIEVTKSLIPLSLKIPLADISAGSYGIYSVDNENVLNIDLITIKIEKTKGREGTIFNELVIPSYNAQRALMFLKSTFSTTQLIPGEHLETQEGKITLTNSCYKPSNDAFTFQINNKPLPNLTKEVLNQIVNSFKIGTYSDANIPVQISIPVSPVFLYCSIQRHFGSIEYLLHQMRNTNEFIQDFNEKFFLTQSFIAEEINITILFNDLNRYIQEYKVLCLIDDTNIEKDKMKSLQFVISNDDVADKKMSIRPFNPQPSLCAIWSFDSAYDAHKEFESKAIDYCTQLTSTYNRDAKHDLINSNGCPQCVFNSHYEGTYAKPQKSICIMNSLRCSSISVGSFISIFGPMARAIDTKEKIKQELGIDSPIVEALEIYSDYGNFKMEPIQLKYEEHDEEEIAFKVKNTLDRTISCKIKKTALRDIQNKYFNDFFDKDYLVYIFKKQETKTITLAYDNSSSHQGYDNLPYHIFCKCFSLVNEGHYFEDKAFIGLSILKSKEKPVIDEPTTKSNCTETPFVIQCLRPIAHDPLPFLNPSLFPQMKPELKSFDYLSYPFQTIMTKAEIVKYEAMTLKSDIVDQTIYLGELLSRINCTKTNDYLKCRAFKTSSMRGIIIKIKDTFTCALLPDDITNLSTIIPSNIVHAALALFYLTNNPESFPKETYGDVFSMTSCMYKHMPQWFAKINEYYKDNLLLENNANGDLLQLLITTSTHLIEVINHLEADSIIKPDEESKIFKLDLIKQMKRDLNSALKRILDKTTIKSLIYDNFYYVNFHKGDYIKNEVVSSLNNTSRSSLLNPVSFDITYLKMKVTMHPYDFFIQNNDAAHFDFFVWKHYPLLPLNPHYASPNVLSFNSYQTNNLMIDEMKEANIDPYPIIGYDYSLQNTSFKYGCYFDAEENNFINLYSSYERVDGTPSGYAKIKIKNIGDYTLGVHTNSYVLLIIALVAVGALLLGGVAYFLYYCIKKQKKNINVICPLIPGQADN